MERENDLLVNTICSIRWIKPLERRAPNQCTAHMIIDFFRLAEANLAIKNGLLTLGKRCSSRKLLPEPTRCMKCQSFGGHYAKECKSLRDTSEHAPENTTPRTALLLPQTSTTVRTARQKDMQLGTASALLLSTYLSATTRTYQTLLTDTSLKAMTQPHGYGRTKPTRPGMNPHAMKMDNPTCGLIPCSQTKWNGSRLTAVAVPHILNRNLAASQLQKGNQNRPSYRTPG